MKLAPSLVLILLLICAKTAQAKDSTYDVRTESGVDSRYGPGTITFVGINPMKYRVGNVSIAGQVALALPSIPDNINGKDYALHVDERAQNNRTPAEIITDVEGDISSAKQSIADLRIQIDNDMGKRGFLSGPTGGAYEYFRSAMASIKGDLSTLSALSSENSKQRRPIMSITNSIKTDKALITALLTDFPQWNRLLQPSDFMVKVNPCSDDLTGGGSQPTATLTLTNIDDSTKQDFSVTMFCQGRFAVSGGFVFSGLSQKTYVAVPTNSAIPSSTATPSATVQEASSNAVQTIPFAFVHYAIAPCAETCTYLSFGSGIQSSGSNGTQVNFAGGVTYGVYRYAFLTVGAQLGQQTVTANGYGVGTPVAAGAMIPTTTRQGFAPFLAVTFGGNLGGGSSPSTTPNTVPTAQPAAPAKPNS